MTDIWLALALGAWILFVVLALTRWTYGPLAARFGHMLYEYALFQGLGKLVEALKRGAVRGVWESADGEIPFTYYTYYYVKKVLHSAGLKLVEARPIYLLPLLPSRVLQRDFKTKPLEKLDLLKPLAPLATTVIYVAKKP